MRAFRGAVLCTLAALAASEGSAQAAWDNVFQVSCFRNRRTQVSQYAPCCPQPVVAAASPCPAPCPPVCTTRYVQRSYYQPVTSYTQRTYYEPVTSYRTSYYYEPVTSYRYSCYYDPCTCSYQQVAVPATSYQLKQRCDPVTSYLQRCQMVPVTSYQLSYYYEPVTTCCSTTTGAPIASLPPGATLQPRPGVGEQQQPQQQPQLQPRIGEEQRSNSFSPKVGTYETQPPPMPGPTDGSFRQPPLRNAPASPASEPPLRDPKVRLDRIVSLPGPNVEGQVVQASHQQPTAGARLLFVRAENDQSQQTAVADIDGHFRATLASGNWLVYVRDRDGVPVFQQKVQVSESNSVPLKLVSR